MDPKLCHNVEPEGTKWGGKLICKNTIKSAIEKNHKYLQTKLKDKKYTEIFLAMGKEYAAALPDLTSFEIKVVFPTSGGPGPKALALKEWLNLKIGSCAKEA